MNAFHHFRDAYALPKPKKPEWSDCGSDPVVKHRIADQRQGFRSGGYVPLPSCRCALPQRTDREQFIDALKAYGSAMERGNDFLHARNKLIELFDKAGK